jgi:DNA adenine methylase
MNLKPKPFIKWVGGKRQILHELRARLPAEFGTYHEPFLGGGALFFDLLPQRAQLSDTNERLVRTYRAVRDRVEDVIARLSACPHDRGFYYAARDIDVDALDDVGVATWFIYMNKTGFNGLYRVNKRGEYNVPFGDQTNPTICDADNLRACSAALRNALILNLSFEHVASAAKPGAFVYFDPPYVPLSTSSSFTAYTRSGFGPAEQAKLRDAARDMKARGVHVLLSNSSAPEVFELYRDGFEIETVGASRAINCKAEGRGKIAETLIR